MKRRISDPVTSSPLVGAKAAWSEYEDLIKPESFTPKKLIREAEPRPPQPKQNVDK